jgi:hypothetical protein
MTRPSTSRPRARARGRRRPGAVSPAPRTHSPPARTCCAHTTCPPRRSGSGTCAPCRCAPRRPGSVAAPRARRTHGTRRRTSAPQGCRGGSPRARLRTNAILQVSHPSAVHPRWTPRPRERQRPCNGRGRLPGPGSPSTATPRPSSVPRSSCATGRYSCKAARVGSTSGPIHANECMIWWLTCVHGA